MPYSPRLITWFAILSVLLTPWLSRHLIDCVRLARTSFEIGDVQDNVFPANAAPARREVIFLAPGLEDPEFLVMDLPLGIEVVRLKVEPMA